MPIYLGHKNTKGLSVSPALKALGIDLLRAPPSAVRIIARPKVVQDGYASYVTHIAAFMQAFVKQETISTNQTGYPVLLPLDKCLDLDHPPLVIDYRGSIPSQHVPKLTDIGFERIKMNKNDNIIRIPSYTTTQAREIRSTAPNATTPAPIGAINLSGLDQWIVVLKIISNFLSAHTYPAFTDDDHRIDEQDDAFELRSE